MDFFTAMNISASALNVQRVKMNVIASNLANIDSTKSEQGGPYRRKDVVISPYPVKDFGETLNSQMEEGMQGVKVESIVEDQRPFKFKYDPSNPEADEKGNVAMPNISLMEEMVNMMNASRSYEANVTALNSAKNMALRALDIGR